MVEYDSIIPPGRTGTLTPGVNISSSRSGPFKKSVRVHTNAANKKELLLTLKGEIVPIIDVSVRYLRLNSGEDNKVDLELKAEKEDLEISHVAFESHSKPRQGASWQTDMPVYVLYEVERSEKPNDKGYYSYAMKLWLKSAPESREHGKFVIKTNHPEKSEISIRGMIE